MSHPSPTEKNFKDTKKKVTSDEPYFGVRKFINFWRHISEYSSKYFEGTKNKKKYSYVFIYLCMYSSVCIYLFIYLYVCVYYENQRPDETRSSHLVNKLNCEKCVCVCERGRKRLCVCVYESVWLCEPIIFERTINVTLVQIFSNLSDQTFTQILRRN